MHSPTSKVFRFILAGDNLAVRFIRAMDWQEAYKLASQSFGRLASFTDEIGACIPYDRKRERLAHRIIHGKALQDDVVQHEQTPHAIASKPTPQHVKAEYARARQTAIVRIRII